MAWAIVPVKTNEPCHIPPTAVVCDLRLTDCVNSLPFSRGIDGKNMKIIQEYDPAGMQILFRGWLAAISYRSGSDQAVREAEVHCVH